jgi:hypothetical protein
MEENKVAVMDAYSAITGIILGLTHTTFLSLATSPTVRHSRSEKKQHLRLH